MALTELLKRLAIAAARAGVDRLVELVRTQVGEPEPKGTPMTHAAVEHNRRQEQASIAASKAAEAARRAAITTRPPKPDTLNSQPKEAPHGTSKGSDPERNPGTEGSG